METTLAIIKSRTFKAYPNILPKVMEVIDNAGLEAPVWHMKEIPVNKARIFYNHLTHLPNYDEIVNSLSESTCLVGSIEGEGAIQKWRKLIGPTDPSEREPFQLRALYGFENPHNGFHGSDSEASFKREWAILFND